MCTRFNRKIKEAVSPVERSDKDSPVKRNENVTNTVGWIKKDSRGQTYYSISICQIEASFNNTE